MSDIEVKENIDTITTKKLASEPVDIKTDENSETKYDRQTLLNDPEHLRAARGTNRYFATEEDLKKQNDPSSVDSDDANEEEICKLCLLPGHYARDCKTIKCDYCGKLNDHKSYKCDKVIKCLKCGQMGHIKKECTVQLHRGKPQHISHRGNTAATNTLPGIGLYCRTCGSRKHNKEKCPDIWRTYKMVENVNDIATLNVQLVFCYRCGRKGHYGDDCKQMSGYSYTSVAGANLESETAFSIMNLPKTLFKEYEQMQKQGNQNYYDRVRENQARKQFYRPPQSYNGNNNSNNNNNRKSNGQGSRFNNGKPLSRFNNGKSNNSINYPRGGRI